MTEATLTSKLCDALRQQLPGAVVFKTADKATKGIPDVYIAWRGGSLWLEVKVLRRGETVTSRITRKKDDALQLLTMRRIFQHTSGGAAYVVYDTRNPRSKSAMVFLPDDVARLTGGDGIERCRLWAEGFDHTAIASFIHEQMADLADSFDDAEDEENVA